MKLNGNLALALVGAFMLGYFGSAYIRGLKK